MKPVRESMAVVMVVLAVSLAGGCSPPSDGDSRPPRTAAPPVDDDASAGAGAVGGEVEFTAVAFEEVRDAVIVTATVHQDHHRLAQVASRVQGRVVRIFVHQGDRVASGQPLVLLDSAEATDAVAALRQTEAQLVLAAQERDRIAPLASEEVLPRKDLLRAEAELLRARAARDAARARLELLDVDEASGAGPGGYLVRAPMAGVISEKTAVIGELAQPDRPLFTVADLSRVWVEANLTDTEIGRVRRGARALVQVAAYPDRVFEGSVTYVGTSADPSTRTVLARIEVDNRDGSLLPFMLATARIDASDGSPLRGAILPTTAVVRVSGEAVVFVRRGDAAEPVPVTIRTLPDGRVLVTDGLVDGDAVAVRGAFELKARLLKSRLGDPD